MVNHYPVIKVNHYPVITVIKANSWWSSSTLKVMPNHNMKVICRITLCKSSMNPENNTTFLLIYKGRICGILLQADPHVLTEVCSEGYTVEVDAPVTLGQGLCVEQNHQDGKETHGRAEGCNDCGDPMADAERAERNIWHQTKREKETKQEAKEMCPVVKPRHESKEKQK